MIWKLTLHWMFKSQPVGTVNCVFVMESSWMVGAYTPSRSVLLWDWGGCEVNRVRKLHRGWAWRWYGLMPASIVLGPRWTTDWVIHCTAYFHFQLIMNQLVPKLIHLCQEIETDFSLFLAYARCGYLKKVTWHMMQKWMILESLSGFSNSSTVITENW